MMNIILALLMSANVTTATVDRIENDYAVIEVGTHMVDVATEEFNDPISEGNQFSVSKTIGTIECLDGDWYQFKSYDDTEWWALTIEDIGFVPEANKTYKLMYYNNGTTDCNECPEEFECECEVYDDILLAIEEFKPSLYPRTMYVDQINLKTNTVTLIDTIGFTWDFKSVEDWAEGDICSCIMYNNGTVNITDDIIVSTRYNGTKGGI